MNIFEICSITYLKSKDLFFKNVTPNDIKRKFKFKFIQVNSNQGWLKLKVFLKKTFRFLGF